MKEVTVSSQKPLTADGSLVRWLPYSPGLLLTPAALAFLDTLRGVVWNPGPTASSIQRSKRDTSAILP